MENQKDIQEKRLEIMEDENLTWEEKKVAIAIIAIVGRKGEMTEEEIGMELDELNIWDMNDLEFKNFIDAMDNIYPSVEN